MHADLLPPTIIERYTETHVRCGEALVIRFFPSVPVIFLRIGEETYVLDVDVIRKQIDPPVFHGLWNTAPKVRTALPGIDGPVISARRSRKDIGRMPMSIIPTDQAKYLDISQTPASASQPSGITRCAGRRLRIDSNDSPEKNPFLRRFVDQVELYLPIGAGECPRTGSEVFVIVVSADISIAILVTSIRVHIPVEIDELESIFPKPLRPSRDASTGSHKSGSPENGGISGCAKIESVAVIRGGEIESGTKIPVPGKNGIMSGSGCGSAYPIPIEIFFVVDFSAFFDRGSHLFDRQIEVPIHVVFLAHPKARFSDLAQNRDGKRHDKRKKRHGDEQLHEGKCGSVNSEAFHAVWLFFLMERVPGKNEFQERANASSSSNRGRKSPIRPWSGSQKKVDYLEQTIFWHVGVLAPKRREKRRESGKNGLEKVFRQTKENEHGIRFGRSA